MVGHLLQYYPAFIALRELAESGALGRLTYIYSNRLSFGKFAQKKMLFGALPLDIMILALSGIKFLQYLSKHQVFLIGSLIQQLCIWILSGSGYVFIVAAS